MNVKKLSKKQLAAIIIPSATLGVAGISTGIYFAVSKINNDSTVEYFNNVVDKINDFKAQTANEFTKGADISSYAGIVENLLFNNNIKKSDGTWYTYKDIENPDIKVTDEKTKKLVTLEEYINNNLYSYFDENSNRVYENMFSILKKKGINSLRLRFWVDPYDEKGNSYGGGHNDLDTNIFIMKQAKKYGFDDFLINFHYSDFWADPGKHYIPKAWENKTDDELLKISYDYTSDVLNKIYKETGIIPKRVQYGNEINKGFLDSYDENGKTKAKTWNFLNDFIIKSIEATNDFQKEHPEIKIDKIIHVEGYSFTEGLMRYERAVRQCDSIHFSFYLQYAYQINVLPKEFEFVRKEFPNQKLYMGEVTYMYSSHGYENINQSGITADDISNSNWDSEFQALTMFQNMQLLSKLLPDIETGFYWWEIGELYLGRFSWSTKEGFSYYRDWDYKERNYQDSNDWSSSTCFDKNGIALPVLDVINNFERNPNLSEYDVYDTNKYFNTNKYENLFEIDLKYFIGKINFLWPKNFAKKDLSKLFINKLNQSAEN
ncbi:MAG: arabinogalactan endo-1,4-beta-galactosidase, partial [Ureaplasma sp.]|nr:arabinogalactan endo-1,4-beta-galactosidase [Ureaplasma sp.]